MDVRTRNHTYINVNEIKKTKLVLVFTSIKQETKYFENSKRKEKVKKLELRQNIQI